MTQLQKIIKYAAMTFAIFLAVSIIGGIVSAVVGLSFAVNVFTVDTTAEIGTTAQTTATFDTATVNVLEIDLAASELYVKQGTALQVTTDREDITVTQKGSTLVIEEEEHLFWTETSTVTLTVPEGYTFSHAEIDTGAGKIYADALSVSELSLSLGAGEATFERLVVSGDTDIEAGAGKLVVRDGAMGKLELELGVGKAEIETALGDGSRIECGVGSLELTLLDKADAYTVRAHTGIGRFTVGGETLTENKTIGNGNTVVTVEGGVGSVDVTFV